MTYIPSSVFELHLHFPSSTSPLLLHQRVPTMSTLINISSKEQFSSLLTSSTIVVADFYADWCGPCKAIAPVYDQLARQLSRPNRITFTKINVDQQQDLARAYGITAMPTFVVFEKGRPVSTVRGADPNKLSEVVRRLASEASKAGNGGEASGESAGGAGGAWLGAAVPKGYSDVTDQVEAKGLDLLNRDSEMGSARDLFGAPKPSALAGGDGKGKGKEKAGESADWVESDTDEQLMLYIPFQARLKIHSLHITSLPPSSSDDDEAPMRPKTIRLYTNHSHVLGFDEAEDVPAVQTVELRPEDWDSKTGTAKIDLRLVKFQNVTSLVVFFVDGEGTSDKLRVDRIRIFGDVGEKREMGKLEKIGDEPGE